MSIRKLFTKNFYLQLRLRPRSPGSDQISQERLLLLGELQDLISYHFHDVSLLQEALTHRSIKVERGIEVRTNDRLEFFGDSLLGFMVTEHLLQQFPGANRAELTARRADIVSNDRLNALGFKLDLTRFIEIGNSIQKNQEGRAKYIVADAMESLIAAIYHDGGQKAAWAFVEREIIDREEV
jgi:ribonuclease-3